MRSGAAQVLGFTAGLFLVAASAACGGHKPIVATTQTTAAKLEVQRSEAVKAERERDDARAALLAERSREMQILDARASAEASDRKERDELATKAWNAIDNADDALASVRGSSSPAVEDALKKKGHVKANLKTLTCAQVLDWPTFKAQTEQAIGALDDAVRRAHADVRMADVGDGESTSKAKAKTRAGATSSK